MNPSRAHEPRYYLRLEAFHRVMHVFLMASFFGLAITGMPLRFNQADWAAAVAQGIGGFGAILFFHKLSALLLTVLFVIHLGYVARLAWQQRGRGIFWGPNSMVPQPRDIVDLYRHFRWFLGLGPRPSFARFAYWEKFDYWAVVWGMAIIGTSGYVLWFSSFFATLLPGWIFNIALLFHAEEALLAVWFIFAIHFFNNHIRPEKFPMDLVIFTGRVTEHELREERGEEYAELRREGTLEAIRTDPPERWLVNLGWLLGTSAVVAGFVLMGLTILAFVAE